MHGGRRARKREQGGRCATRWKPPPSPLLWWHGERRGRKEGEDGSPIVVASTLLAWRARILQRGGRAAHRPSWHGERAVERGAWAGRRRSGMRTHRHGQQEGWRTSEVRAEKVEMERISHGAVAYHPSRLPTHPSDGGGRP
jgi:hypothetical protein